MWCVASLHGEGEHFNLVGVGGGVRFDQVGSLWYEVEWHGGDEGGRTRMFWLFLRGLAKVRY